MQYPARLIYQRGEGGYAVRFRDVPEALTCGVTKRDALRHVVDALETALAYYVKDGKPIPEPSKPVGREEFVRLTTSVTARVLLYNELCDQQVDLDELAKRMNRPRRAIKSMMNLLRDTNFDMLAKAFAALGKRLELHLVAVRKERAHAT